MEKIGFIGAYDKIDMIVNVAKVLTLCGKKVIVVDSTILQKARYIIPTMTPTASYITDYNDIDFAIGYKNIEQIKQYMHIEGELPYDVMLIDIDNPYNIEGFGLETVNKNYFVTGFDPFSVKRGMQITSLVKVPINLSLIIFSQEMTGEEKKYIEYLSLGHKVVWDNNEIYFPTENGDATVIAENQRSARINFRKISTEYKYALLALTKRLVSDVDEKQIKKAIRILGE